MHWNELIAEISAVGASGDSAQMIAGIEYDSRRIKPGAVFVAMKGGSTDGNRYIDKAIGNGALGIITDSSPTFDHLLVYRAGLPVLESNTAAAPLPRLRPPSSVIPSARSPLPALPAPTARPRRHSSQKL
jgi:UDP-N-acetylmuramyl pentapeptide synthase